jgi:hypothetical protein
MDMPTFLARTITLVLPTQTLTLYLVDFQHDSYLNTDRSNDIQQKVNISHSF